MASTLGLKPESSVRGASCGYVAHPPLRHPPELPEPWKIAVGTALASGPYRDPVEPAPALTDSPRGPLLKSPNLEPGQAAEPSAANDARNDNVMERSPQRKRSSQISTVESGLSVLHCALD